MSHGILDWIIEPKKDIKLKSKGLKKIRKYFINNV